MGFLEERNGNLAGDDAEVCGICNLEKLIEDALLFCSKIQVRMSLCYKFGKKSPPLVPMVGASGVASLKRGWGNGSGAWRALLTCT